jgi:hypothetical protein
MEITIPKYLQYQAAPETVAAREKLVGILEMLQRKVATSNHLQVKPMVEDYLMPALQMLTGFMTVVQQDLAVHTMAVTQYFLDQQRQEVLIGLGDDEAEALLEGVASVQALLTDDTPEENRSEKIKNALETLGDLVEAINDMRIDEDVLADANVLNASDEDDEGDMYETSPLIESAMASTAIEEAAPLIGGE